MRGGLIPEGVVTGAASQARFGALTALGVFLADQMSKLWILFWVRLEDTGPWQLLPFMEFVMVWNRGISYGLFQQSSDVGRWALVALSIAAAVWMGFWLKRSLRRMEALALGLIIGGALGNVVDRIAYGAVADFVHLHWGDFSWYVFNIADAAIVVGVVALMYDALKGGAKSVS
ncbi:MAG: signal peptidase II [Bosea sp. (in: a-proteobacteria)]